MTILIQNVSKKFDNVHALQDVYLEIKTNRVVALVGGSGSGKSTLLRIIAGLDTPDSGSIWLHGKDSAFMSVQERGIGFVFQSYALFPHMSVYENIQFALEVNTNNVRAQSARAVRNEIKERCMYLLKMIELQNLAHYYPRHLSGGQKQRVALARSLAASPSILLLDEPFNALDMRMRKQLRDWIRSLRKYASISIVLVTHDYKEALEVANEIVMLKDGRIEQHGPPKEFYNNFVERGFL